MNKTKQIVYSALFIALGVVIPIAFHFFNMGGKVFLPMHIPVLIAGLILNPIYAFTVGLLTPVLSSVLTQMPPVMPMLPIMMAELATYALVASVMRKKFKMPVILSLIIAMVIGRVIAGVTVFLMANLFSVKIAGPIEFISGGIVTGAIGILIQLIFVPAIVYAIEKSNRKNNSK